MLATTHPQGVRLWGGSSWGHLQRFHHPFVTLIDFSPQENYLVTWSNEPFSFGPKAEQGPQHPSLEDEGNTLAVWDIKTGNLLRTFPVTSTEQPNGDSRRHMQWPALKWSPDDKYVARVVPGQQISVYELPSMSLLDRKSIKIDGIVDFEWCPLGDKDTEVSGKTGKKTAKENVIVYWVPEIANQPARVSLMGLPSRSILRSKNLFNVSDVSAKLQQTPHVA
jgi:translation initiation factor 3 subunit B